MIGSDAGGPVASGGNFDWGAFGAGALNAGASAVSNRRQRDWATEEAKKNRQFQERMSSTAYQRSVNDMRAAGLNPLAVYGSGGGGGASTPSGSVASGVSEMDLSGATEGIYRGISTALERKRLQKDIEIAEAQKESLKESADKTKTEKELLELTRKTVDMQQKYNQKKIGMEMDNIHSALLADRMRGQGFWGQVAGAGSYATEEAVSTARQLSNWVKAVASKVKPVVRKDKKSEKEKYDYYTPPSLEFKKY